MPTQEEVVVDNADDDSWISRVGTCSESDEPQEVPQVDSRGPAFAVLVVGAFVVFAATSEPAREGAELSWALDPLGYFTISRYVCLYLASIPVKEMVSSILGVLARVVLRLKRIDEGKVKKLEALEAVDLAYLALNSLVEFVGMNHVAATILQGSVEQHMHNFYVTNGPLAFIFAMILNDVLYYPFHVVAHRREFYPFCHQQHHRQLVPFRGYADAANRHPLEHIVGFSALIASLHLTSRLLGLHVGAAVACFLAWALLNIANHFPFDSHIHLPIPFPALPRDHQMHHRFPQSNFGTLTSLCDRLFGTFRPYRAIGDPGPPPPRELQWYERMVDPALPKEPELPFQKEGRPDFFPSPWSFIGVLVSLVACTVLVEFVRLGELPPWHEYIAFTKTAIMMVNMSLFCFAVDSACSGPAKPKKKVEKLYVKPRMKDKVKDFKEAVPAGHHKQFVGGKGVWKADLSVPIGPQHFKGE